MTSVKPALNRRTVVKAGAWTAPAVAVASMAPAAAASPTPTCPVLTGDQISLHHQSGTGQQDSGSWAVSAPNDLFPNGYITHWRSNASETEDYIVYAEAMLPVEAGQTYTFTSKIETYYHGENLSREQTLEVTIDGVRPTGGYGATRHHWDPGTTDTLAYFTMTYTYTAAETGVVPIRFTFNCLALGRYGGQTRHGSDDIKMEIPTIVCS